MRSAPHKKGDARALARIIRLEIDVEKLKQRVDQEEARAGIAEREARQLAAERDIWKFQAMEAEAALKSLRGAN